MSSRILLCFITGRLTRFTIRLLDLLDCLSTIYCCMHIFALNNNQDFNAVHPYISVLAGENAPIVLYSGNKVIQLYRHKQKEIINKVGSITLRRLVVPKNREITLNSPSVDGLWDIVKIPTSLLIIPNYTYSMNGDLPSVSIVSFIYKYFFFCVLFSDSIQYTQSRNAFTIHHLLNILRSCRDRPVQLDLHDNELGVYALGYNIQLFNSRKLLTDFRCTQDKNITYELSGEKIESELFMNIARSIYIYANTNVDVLESQIYSIGNSYPRIDITLMAGGNIFARTNICDLSATYHFLYRLTFIMLHINFGEIAAQYEVNLNCKSIMEIDIGSSLKNASCSLSGDISPIFRLYDSYRKRFLRCCALTIKINSLKVGKTKLSEVSLHVFFLGNVDHIYKRFLLRDNANLKDAIIAEIRSRKSLKFYFEDQDYRKSVYVMVEMK